MSYSFITTWEVKPQRVPVSKLVKKQSTGRKRPKDYVIFVKSH